jgi:hypothetical protein
MIELKVTGDGKDALEMVVYKVNMKTQEEKKHTYKLEQKLKGVFTKILDNTQETMSNVEA